MRNLSLILLLLAGLKSYSQNLVPNGSFEDTISCPFNLNFTNYVTHWFTTHVSSTPDYYHECSSTLNVPNTGYGFQNAHTGNAYIGIFLFDSVNYNGHEFIQVPLLDTLQEGKCYEVSFYVSLLDEMKFACNDIGVYFSSSALTSSSWIPPVTPQVVNNGSSNPLISKNDWTLVTGKYVAAGGESYITIGNFNDDAAADTQYVGPASALPIAYYLIDDVSLIECAEFIEPVKNVFTPNGDGVNDIFSITGYGIENMSLEIYNRWGIKVAVITQPNQGWDGRTTSGEEAVEGVYYYLLNAKSADGNKIIKTGFFHLLK